MNIYEKLQMVQNELHVPKNLTNKFGGYNYRNAEGICEAAKPILAKHGLALTISDEIFEICGRIYVKAYATVHDFESNDVIMCKAFAREPEEKKGMDAAQITGTCSSYARKYALNGLFLLDDTKDPDSEEYKTTADAKAKAEVVSSKKKAEPAAERITPDQLEVLKAKAKESGTSSAKIKEIFNIAKVEDMNQVQFEACIKKLESLAKAKEEK